MLTRFSDLPQLKVKRTFELILDLLKEKILSGDLSPGDRLPPERSLAETLGVGRPSVREAYRALELLGVIQVRKGNEGGAFIAEPSESLTSRTISDLMRWHHVDLPTLAEARRFIERGTAELAAQRASKDDLAALEELLDRAGELAARGESVAELGLEFHSILARAAGNPLLYVALLSVTDLMRHILRKINPTAEATRKELQEHRRLVEAVSSGQAGRAGELMDHHLRESQRRLESLADRAQESDPESSPGHRELT